MSKTIVIMDAPDDALGIESVGEENPYFLGAFGEVICALRQQFPQGDYSEPTDIRVKTDKGDIRIEIAKHTPVQSFMIHMDNPETLEVVRKLCEKTHWRALDTDTGMFIEARRKSTASSNSNSGKSWWQLWKK